jgi:BRCT domain type II-containing protein
LNRDRSLETHIRRAIDAEGFKPLMRRLSAAVDEIAAVRWSETGR